MRFSLIEIRDIIIATLALAFIFGGIDSFFISLFAVGITFLGHELLGHKLVAQYLGSDAEFRMWPFGLLLGVITGLLPFGIIFAAPGAVYISHYVRKRIGIRYFLRNRDGMIAAAGPAVNIIIGMAFLYLLSSYDMGQFTGLITITAKISFFLALFNLLPFPPLDGSKVFRWSKVVWLFMIWFAFFGYMPFNA